MINNFLNFILGFLNRLNLRKNMKR